MDDTSSDVAPANGIAKMPCTSALVYGDTIPSSGVAASGLLGAGDNEIEALFDGACGTIHAAESFEMFFGTARSSPDTAIDTLVQSDKELAALVGSTSTEAAAIQTLLEISTLALPLPVSVARGVVPLIAMKRKTKVCQCDLSGCDAVAIFNNVALSKTTCAVKGGVKGESIRLNMLKNGITTTKQCKCEKPPRYYLCCDECPQNWIDGHFAVIEGMWKQSMMAISPHDKTAAFMCHIRGTGHIFWRTVRAMGGIVKEAQENGVLITSTIDWVENGWTVDHWKRCCNIVNTQRKKFPLWCSTYDRMIPGVLDVSKAAADPTSVAMKFQVAGRVLQFISSEIYQMPPTETVESDIPAAYSSTKS